MKVSEVGNAILMDSFLIPSAPRDEWGSGTEVLYAAAEALQHSILEVSVNEPLTIEGVVTVLAQSRLPVGGALRECRELARHYPGYILRPSPARKQGNAA